MYHGLCSCIWNDMEDKDRKMIKKELDLYRKKGVGLYLEGRASSPGNIARACAVAEHGTYMRDSCQDDKGNLKRINFTFIEDKE